MNLSGEWRAEGESAYKRWMVGPDNVDVARQNALYGGTEQIGAHLLSSIFIPATTTGNACSSNNIKVQHD